MHRIGRMGKELRIRRQRVVKAGRGCLRAPPRAGRASMRRSAGPLELRALVARSTAMLCAPSGAPTARWGRMHCTTLTWRTGIPRPQRLRRRCGPHAVRGKGHLGPQCPASAPAVQSVRDRCPALLSPAHDTMQLGSVGVAQHVADHWRPVWRSGWCVNLAVRQRWRLHACYISLLRGQDAEGVWGAKR